MEKINLLTLDIGFMLSRKDHSYAYINADNFYIYDKWRTKICKTRITTTTIVDVLTTKERRREQYGTG